MKKSVCWLLLFFLSTSLAYSQQATSVPPQKTRILFVLDASGSMLAPWEEGNRMDAAKRLLAHLVDSLKVNPTLELGLRVYGHQARRQKNDCQDSKLEVPFAPDNHTAIIKKLISLQPQGNTPLAYSLLQAAEDFPDHSQYRNIVILITDGIESCGGDPCAVSQALQKKRIFLKPFVIAMSQEEGMPQQFNCMGNFYDASNMPRFRAALSQALKKSLGKTTLMVQLLDEQNRPSQTNLTLTFVNSTTGEALYNIMHYRNNKGATDTLIIDPVPTYDLYVNTLPPLVKRQIALEGGTHHTIVQQAPEGVLQLKQSNHQEYKSGVKALVRLAGRTETVHAQPMSTSQKYLAGVYDLEVLTLPRQYFYNVEIKGGQSQALELAAPGVLNVRADVASWIDLYRVREGNVQELILPLDDKKPINSLALQPGSYRLVYRAKNAQGSKFTQVKDFTISSGKTVTLNLFGR